MEENLKTKNDDINPMFYSPLVLAYMGDAYYELYIRKYVLEKGNRPVNKLHKDSTFFVKANTQAKIGKYLVEFMSEEEKSVYKRGRNASSHTIAKNASMSDYRHATGFEAFVGYLYLKKEDERLDFMLDKAIKFLGEE